MEERGRQRALQSARGNQNDQDSDEDDDLHDAQLWHHRRLQRQVGFLGIGGSFSGELSPQPSSSGCEQRVSPLDPNLSSAACYSPQPPYSSPIGALNRPDSPIEVLAHSGSLATIQPNSNISSARESIAALPRPQARWPHEAAMSYEDDEDEGNDDDDDNEDNEEDIDVEASQEIEGWNKSQHVQTAQRSSPQPGRSSGPVSPRPGPSGIQPLRPAVDCDSDIDDEQNQGGFMSVNPHLVNSNFNQNNNSEEAEALETFGSGCEASSSDRDHMSPLGSPQTPGDNCVVSSSTGQIDSVPPTPVEFQGNDASAPPSPSSPRSPPRMVGVAILDSTVDSSSGRGLEAPGRDMFGESDENEENVAAAAGAGSINHPGLHRVVEEGAEAAAAVSNSSTVELLENPQPPIFSNNHSNESRFIEQLSFSLSNLSDRYNTSQNSRQEQTQNKNSSSTSGSQPYLLIPGSSRASLHGHPHSASVSVTKSTLKRVSGPDQPSTSKTHIKSNALVTPNSGNRQSVAEINSECLKYRRTVTGNTNKISEKATNPIEVDLGNRDQIRDRHNVRNGSISTTASTSQNIIGSLRDQYILGLNENSLNSDGSLSSGNGLGVDGEEESLAEGSNNNNHNHNNLRSKGNCNSNHGAQIHTSKIPLVTQALNLNIMTSSEMDNDLNKVPGGSKSSANEQREPRSLPSPTHIMQNASDQVSLLVGNNEGSNDGTLLMMVSSNGHSLHSALALDDSIDVDGENSLGSNSMEDSNPGVASLSNQAPLSRPPQAPLSRPPQAHTLFTTASSGTLETRNSVTALSYNEHYPHFFPNSSSSHTSTSVSNENNIKENNFPFLAPKTSQNTIVSNSNSNSKSNLNQNNSDEGISKVPNYSHNVHSLFNGSQTTSIRPLTKSLNGRGVKGSSLIRSNVRSNEVKNSSTSSNTVLKNASASSLSKDDSNSINGIISNNSNREYISNCDNISSNKKSLITQGNQHTPVTSQQGSCNLNSIISSSKSNGILQNNNAKQNKDIQTVSNCLPSVSINPSIISNSLFANNLENDVISSSQACSSLTNNIVDINAPTTQSTSFSILQPISSNIPSSTSSTLPHLSLPSTSKNNSTAVPSISVTDNSPFLSGSPVVLSSIHNRNLDINLDHQQESEANILEASRADLEERKEHFGEKKDFDDPLKLSTSENVQDDFIGPDFWCGECGQSYAYECHQHRVLTISDKPVMTRAWASLPAAHLTIKAIPEENCSGVFSRKVIPQRTQFGPLEGVMSQDNTGNPSQGLLYSLDRGDHFLHIDTTDESFCNWMKFVRPASTYLEQNCIVFQQGKGLYFLTTTKISPRTELRVGYSKVYGERRDLQILEPTAGELKFLESQRKTWSCYECDECFESSAELQHHLDNHDEYVEEDKKKKKKYKSRRLRGSEDGDEPVRKGAKKLKVDGQSSSSTSQLELERNKEEILDSPIIYKCKLCGIHFNSHKLNEIHSLGHEEEKSNENEEYNNNMRNIKHEKLVITEEKNNLTDCPECNKKFESTPDLISHVNEHGFYSHSSKAYKCNYCYKSFSRQERLEAHMSVHGNEAEKPFSCNVCLRRFCNNSALACHIKVHTEGRKGYDCPICRNTFSSVSQLKSHVKQHCINGEYLCPTCHKKFPSYHKIRRHIRAYHAITPVICTICSKDLPSHDKLKTHMLSHSDRRDFLCPDCGKRFKRKDKLREHVKRMHSAERETKPEKMNNKGPPKFVPKVDPSDYKQFVYKCHSCLLGFKRRGMLVNHLAKRHPQIIPSSVPELNQPILKATRCYYCQYCEKMYRSSSKRKLHILKNHPGAELPPPAKRENEADTGDDPSFSQTTGATPVYAHNCEWCHRQYASRARLLRHHRQNHPDLFNEEAAAAEGGVPHEYATDAPDRAHVSGEVDMILDGPQALTRELSIEGQIVAEGNIIRGHRLVSIGGNGSGRSDGSSDLLTQAMGEISPLGSGAHGEQYVRLVSNGSIMTSSGSSTDGSQAAVVVSGSGSGSGRGALLVATAGETEGTINGGNSRGALLVAAAGETEGTINDGGSNCSTTTLALVTADGADHTVTISLPPGQFISLIPGLTVASGASQTTTSPRSIPSTSINSSVVALEASELATESGSSNRSGVTAHSGEVGGSSFNIKSFMTPTIAQPVPQQEAEAQEEMVMHDSHTLTTLTNSHTF